jgi:hypothetical protein
MIENYSYKYQDDAGRLIFVPTNASREFGNKLIARILKRWQPPNICYHLLPGGHVAAARAHLPNGLFVRMDIRHFFDTITRTKVHRSLRGIGFKQRHAYDAALRSTVSKATSGSIAPYSLPFGFVQSPMLATLALMSSALGGAIAALHAAGVVTVSVYMDDIILSGRCVADLAAAKESLEAVATVAGFTFNSKKGSGPAPFVTVFNLDIQHNHMELTPDRFARFTSDILTYRDKSITGGILSYVSVVDVAQTAALAAL